MWKNWWLLKRPGFEREKFEFCWYCRLQQSHYRNKLIYLALLWEEDCYLGNRTTWVLGSTPPWAMVTPWSNLFKSSSFRMANCKCRGMIFLLLLSLAAFPANSKISRTPTQLQGRLGHQLQLSQRSFLCECIGGFVQRGSADQLGVIVSLRL